MTAKKRPRSDSTAAAVAAFAASAATVEPPMPLSEAEMYYWNAIIRARPLDEWTAIDKMHAWNLSKTMQYIADSHADIATNGLTIVNERGTPIDNPAIRRLETLSRLSITYSVKLHIHAEATVGRSEDSAKRATKQRQAQDTLGSLKTQEHELSDFINTPVN